MGPPLPPHEVSRQPMLSQAYVRGMTAWAHAYVAGLAILCRIIPYVRFQPELYTCPENVVNGHSPAAVRHAVEGSRVEHLPGMLACGIAMVDDGGEGKGATLTFMCGCQGISIVW